MGGARPMSAMISYQSRDRDAAELLHEELALRGFVVVHDQCTFPSGSRIATEMLLGVETCDAFVAYLTPESLYLDAQPGAPRPALDEEFRPAMDRRREPRPGAQEPRPVVLPVPKRLGTRSEAADTVFSQTGESIGALWMKSVRTDDPQLSQAEAAAVAGEALQATLRPNQRYVEAPVPLTFFTRGNAQPPRFLTLDGTSLVGGTRRVGSQQDWERIVQGLRDVETTLARSESRSLDVVAKAHITGGIALGRVFHQSAGWHLSVAGRYDSVRPSPMEAPDILNVGIDPQGRGGDLSCEVSLVGQPVFEMAREAIRELHLNLAERLQLTPKTPGEIDGQTASRMAGQTAWALRDRVAYLRPPRTHIFCASPVEVAVLLGHRLTGLGTDLHLYEPDGNSYQLALVLPKDLP